MSDINIKIFNDDNPIILNMTPPEVISVPRLGLPENEVYLTLARNLNITGNVIQTNVSVFGTTNEVEVTTDPNSGDYQIGLPDDVTIPGTMTAEHFHGQLLGTVAFECKNTSGSVIPKGHPVYSTGTVGATHVVEVAPALNTLNVQVLGVANAQMNNNDFGEVIAFGLVQDIDTNANNWTIGDRLYLADASSTPTHSVRNGLTHVRPTEGNNCQPLAILVRKNANNGSIMCFTGQQENKVNRMSLNDLTNVTQILSGPQTESFCLVRGPSADLWNEYAISNFANAVHNHTLSQLTPSSNPTTNATWDAKVPEWDDTMGVWVPVDAGASGTYPDGASFSSGEVPEWSGTAWTAIKPPDGNDLTANKIAFWNGTAWVEKGTSPYSTDSNIAGGRVPQYAGGGIWNYTEVDGPTTRAFMESECNTAQDLTSYVQNSGTASFTTSNTYDGHPGILTCTTGGTANGVGGIGFAISSNGVILGTDSFVFDCVLMLPTLSTAAQTYLVEVGCSSSRTSTPTNAVVASYTHGQQSGKWTLNVYDTNSLIVSAASNITVAANTWYHIRVEIVPAFGANWYCNLYVNGTLECQQLTTIPSGVSKVMSLINQIRKTNGTGISTAYIDYASFKQVFANPR